MNQPDLSIIIPILNEAEQLPELLADLQRQQQVVFEVLIVDGGSDDGGPKWLQQQYQQQRLSGAMLETTAGRGLQMNVGGKQARSAWLLFLHVDSRFDDPLALRKGLDALQQTGSQKLAGHFSLKFRRTDVTPSVGYYYYEWKARLGRPETIHGDQGFLLRRDFYQQLGGFREDLPVMEDTDFAERLREQGNWQLLPIEISTSARRFEQEGLWQRQLLGALIMCFRSIGWLQFFSDAPAVYRQQSKTDQLQVRPFFLLLHSLFLRMDRKAAWRIWRQSGAYVRGHAWQLPFALDARRAFHRGVPVGQGRMMFTSVFEPIYELLTDNPLGRFVAIILLRIWFVLTSLWLKSKEQRPRCS